MGEMILVKATQEVKEVVGYATGLNDSEEVEGYTVAEDGRAYIDDEFVVVALECEVDMAIEEFMRNYKRGLANTWKYGVTL